MLGADRGDGGDWGGVSPWKASPRLRGVSCVVAAWDCCLFAHGITLAFSYEPEQRPDAP